MFELVYKTSFGQRPGGGAFKSFMSESWDIQDKGELVASIYDKELAEAIYSLLTDLYSPRAAAPNDDLKTGSQMEGE